MTTEKRKKQIEVDDIIYKAADGTEFKSEDECRKYEDSAKFAVKQLIGDKLKKFNASNSLLHLTYGWCEDEGEYYAFKPESTEDIENLIRYMKVWFNTDMYMANHCEFKVGTIYVIVQSNCDEACVDVFEEQSFLSLICKKVYDVFGEAKTTCEGKQENNK